MDGFSLILFKSIKQKRVYANVSMTRFCHGSQVHCDCLDCENLYFLYLTAACSIASPAL
jgi:hypothetical protein